MKDKVIKLTGAIALALLLICGFITGLASAGSQSSASLNLANKLPSAKLALPTNNALQAATCPGFNDIVGATYDPNTNELIIVGQITGTLPMMNYNYVRENLVVAMRAVHAALQYPGVTIGTTPSPDPSYQLVEYFGDITDTHYGYVFFEADRLLKSYSLGKDNLNPTEPFTSSVPGYTSFFDRYLALEDTTPVPVSQRFWFSPTLNAVTVPGDPYGVVFSNTKVNLLWAYLPGSGTSAKAEQAADDFVNHFNAHYHEFAAEQAARNNQTFNELIQFYKLFGIAHWTLTDTAQLNVAGINAPWLDNYPVTSMTTPDTTPTVSRTGEFFTGSITYTIIISGGVTVENPNYNSDPIAQALIDDIRNTRPSGQPVWEIDSEHEPCISDIDGLACPCRKRVAMAIPFSENYVINGSFEGGPGSPPWVQKSEGSGDLIIYGAGLHGDYGGVLGSSDNDSLSQDVLVSGEEPIIVSYSWGMSSSEPLSSTSLSISQSSSELPPFIFSRPIEPLSPVSLPPQSSEAPDVSTSSDDITPAAAKDFMYVEVLDTDDNLSETLKIITNDDVRNQWQSEGFPLNAYQGQTIRIRFRATNDATNRTFFFIDDVSVDTASSVNPGCTFLPITLKNAQ